MPIAMAEPDGLAGVDPGGDSGFDPPLNISGGSDGDDTYDGDSTGLVVAETEEDEGV